MCLAKTKSVGRDGFSSPFLYLINADRTRRVTEVLKELHLDAVICSSASEVLLLTGYWPVMGASVAILTAEGDAQVVLPEDEIELARQTSGASLIPYKPSGLTTLATPIQSLSNPLQLLTSKLGLRRGVIGIQTEQGMQPASYASCTEFRSSLVDLLRQLLPEANYLACDDAFQQMEARKTSKELDCMRRAAEIAAAGFDNANEFVQAGKREPEIAAAFQAAFKPQRKRRRSSEVTVSFSACQVRTPLALLPRTHAPDNAQLRREI